MISLVDAETFMTSRAVSSVEDSIQSIRGQRVMLDVDLAGIYGVTTKRLNEQLRRNLKRFPSDFAFQLTREEFTWREEEIALRLEEKGEGIDG